MYNKITIDGLRCYRQHGEIYCKYEDYLESNKPKTEKDFINWCKENSIIGLF